MPTGISRRSRTFTVAEGKEFQFRAEFFNFLNHPNFHLPDSDIEFANLQLRFSKLSLRA